MLEGDIKTIKELDKVFGKTCDLVKDSSGKGRRVYTKIYVARGNPIFKRVRVFFDEREKKGTVKIQDYLGLWVGACTFTLIQASMLIEGAVRGWL